MVGLLSLIVVLVFSLQAIGKTHDRAKYLDHFVWNIEKRSWRSYKEVTFCIQIFYALYRRISLYPHGRSTEIIDKKNVLYGFIYKNLLPANYGARTCWKGNLKAEQYRNSIGMKIVCYIYDIKRRMFEEYHVPWQRVI